MTRGKAAPEKLIVLERRAKALILRKQGGSYRLIAAQLRGTDGVSKRYSEGAAHADVIAELNRLNAENSESAEELRRLEEERIDQMLAAIYPQANNGDLFAIDRVLRLMERRAKYRGLDAPTKIAVNDLDDLIEKELQRIAGQSDK